MKTQDQISGECAWCEKPLSETVHGIGSSYSENIPHDDTFHQVPLRASGKSLYGAVIRGNSKAFPEGFRLIFASCSDSCAEEIDRALSAEKPLFEIRTKLTPPE